LSAALALAVLSRGDAIVLAALLTVGAWRPLPAVGVISALAATAWRWSSTSLEDVAGAQAVLGPAGVVDPPSAAASAWLGALALVLATPNLVEAWLSERAEVTPRLAKDPPWVKRILEWLPPLAFGAGAAVIVAGPAPGGDVWARVGAAVVAVGLARLLAGRRRVLDRHLVLDGLAAGLGLGALVAVAIDAPPLDDLVDVAALVEGLLISAAVALVVLSATVAVRLQAARPADGPIAEGRR
jgi:hypothetical protein